jgi:hypothetical protein
LDLIMRRRESFTSRKLAVPGSLYRFALLCCAQPPRQPCARFYVARAITPARPACGESPPGHG